jgi:hypothetical protein
MRNLVLAGFLTFAVATPALAASYYVVQDTSTGSCQIIQQTPPGAGQKLVGNLTGYSSQSQAQSAMQTLPDCKA